MLCAIALSPAWAQEKVTLSGTIKDGSTGEDLIGAAVVIPSMPGTGAITNVYGFYSLTLPAGQYTVRYQYVGYEAQELEVDLTSDKRLAIELNPSIEQLEEVVVTSERLDQNVTSVDMGLTKLDPAQVANIPVLFGEQDIFKTIQLLPGIQSAGEGGSGFFVRGGSADQNLILIDEANVYNASHLLGFFSVFNSDAIRDLQIYKGLMPAQYGGRLSSVLDVKMKEGNNKEFGAQGGVGLISSRLTVEGPIVKDRASFMASGRRTYADLFIPLANNDDLDGTQLFFYDLNMKANALINENNRVYLSGYFGRDVFAFAENFGFNWGNATGTARWNTVINDKLFLNSSAIFTNYDYEIGFGDLLTISSGLQDWQLKEDFFWYPNENNTVQFGFTGIHHTFRPTTLAAPEGGPFNDSDATDRFALETAAYVQNDQKIGTKLSVRYGLRVSNFNSIGPATYYTYDGGVIADSVVLGDNEIGNPYWGLEPRLGFSYLLSPTQSIKGSYNRTYQYLHLLSSSTSANPTDVWIPSSPTVKPQIANQYSVGYFQNFDNNKYETSVELYYKDMANQIDYSNGANLFGADDIESLIAFGRGWSYGAEFLVRKNVGDFTGWVSYTLSKTMRQFDEINEGNPYPARQDRRHDIAIVGSYQLTPNINISGNWVYFTGNAVTFPSGKYVVNGQIVNYYTERNGYRMPDYHRLDLGLTWITRKTERFEGSWNFSCYNVYGRQNAYTITFEESETNPGETEAVQLSLFRWVPSVAYNFKF
ncbi:MAG TPA: hypothetical protein DCE41_36910 [Cytophagales bacterium]|nr:hypothetical protein [Cytophagales bacterium]HAA21151.1 hypothetical protein [Cytophagales bacterium]HAP60672.1 hypothetical protein [Cytophagales bacterium]